MVRVYTRRSRNRGMKHTTIAYITSRQNPRVEWFVDSLARQVPVEERHLIHLVFVDRHLWAITPEAGNTYWRRGDLISLTDERWHVESRREMFAQAVRGRFDYQLIPPKPCMHQGPFRLTSRDFFCAANSRNTAIMATRHDYFLCVDDLSVLLPSWWPNARYAVQNALCCAGVYWKQKKIVVEDGEIKSHEEYKEGRDTRWEHTSEGGIIPWHGSAIYGCSFGAPTEMLLKVNGVDELCNGAGQDDYEMGIRMERAGARWVINRNLQSWESEEGHHEEPSLPRERKIVTPENLPSNYASYPKARDDEQFYSDHVFLNRLRHENRTTPLAQWTNLRKAREEFLVSQRAMIPTEPQTDWRDGAPLSSL